MGLTRDDSHIYHLGPEILPGVTEVLADVGVIDYSKIPHDVREAGKNRGRVIHLQTYLDDRGTLDEDLADMGYVEGWRKFRKDWNFNPIRREFLCYHPQYFYAGQIDAEDEDETVDIKTGTPEAWVRYQTAAYAATQSRAKKRTCVVLPGDGTYKRYSFPVATYRTDLAKFLAALTVFRMRREDKKL